MGESKIKRIHFTHENMMNYIFNFNPIEHKYKCCSEVANCLNIRGYENINKPTNLEKHSYSDMIDNTSIIYGDSRKASEYSMLYKRVMDKFILQYLGIQGLSALYNEHYMDFEWNMHSNLNFENHSNSYYRDHFIHEIRNLYMMFQLLDDNYIFKNTEENLFSPNLSKLSKYVVHQLKIWKGNIPCLGCDELNEQEIDVVAFFKRYVIYASTIFACLFMI